MPTWIIIADRRFEQPFGVLGAPGADHFEAGAVPVPGGEALRVLGAHARRGAVGPPEHDGDGDGARRHVTGLGSRVDHLVDGLHGEVERHEFAHRSQPRLLSVWKCGFFYVKMWKVVFDTETV